jgi:NO-binding membrane sensor protein with MHYT domain
MRALSQEAAGKTLMNEMSMMHVEPTYNFLLVALSYCVSVFGSYTSLQLIEGIRSQEKSSVMWLIGAALALGGGAIWTMHFIGMLAYDMGMPVGYDPLITFASLIIAIIVVGIGIALVSAKSESTSRLIVAGIITGLGVASMHYSGMEAMVMAANHSYDTGLLLLSLVIAIVAATAALWLAFNLSGNLHKLGASFIMGVAVCGMHYTGMAAMTMTPTGEKVHIESSMEPMTMGLMVFGFSMLLLVLSLIVALSQLNQRMYEEMESLDDDDELLSRDNPL